MARVEVPITVINKDNGAAVSGASVTIKNRTTGSPASVYLTETTPTPEASNTVLTDANGRVNAWVPAGIPYVATISGTGVGTYDEPFEGSASTPGPNSARIGWSLGGVVLVPANNTNDIGVVPGVYIEPAPGETLYIAKIRYKTHSGSVTFRVERNGTAINWGSGTTLTAGTGGGSNTLATPIALAAGDYIQMKVLTNPSNLGYGLAVTVALNSYSGE